LIPTLNNLNNSLRTKIYPTRPPGEIDSAYPLLGNHPLSPSLHKHTWTTWSGELKLFYTAKTLTPTPHNLDKEEQLALQQLMSNPDITIKPADKGGAVVAMNTVDYLNACRDMLKDTTHYQPYTDECWDVTHAPDHTDFILSHMHDMGMITDGNLGACLSTHGKHKDRLFFGLPKVHRQVATQHTTTQTHHIRLP
jgi:hypothetical protein